MEHFEVAVKSSKHALFREAGTPNSDKELDEFEKELKDELNKLRNWCNGNGWNSNCFSSSY